MDPWTDGICSQRAGVRLSLHFGTTAGTGCASCSAGAAKPVKAACIEVTIKNEPARTSSARR